MATNHVGVLLRHVRRMIGERPEETADAALLERFAQHADESAFAALMHRHGPLVWSVSQRVARHEQDAEDVFQATFLLLARKAGTIRKKGSVASWLYGVAQRLALRARSDAARRRQREEQASGSSTASPTDELTWRELRDALDDELARLPDKYRAPLLLCYFEGLTQDEAARQLGWSKRSVKDRLERGRHRLRCGLARRGVTLTAALAGTVLADAGAAPAALTAATLRAAAPFALRRSLQGVISAGALALAEGGVHCMVAGKFCMLVVALAAALLLAGYQVATVGEAPQRVAADGPLGADARTGGVDAYGDPLPPGAVARLGTIRYRSGGMESAFLPDGKTVVSVDQNHAIKLWEARTGRLVREIDTGNFSAGSQRGMALSADGKRLAVSGSIHDNAQPGWRSAARVFDLATGNDIRTVERLPREGVNALAMTPDGKLLFTLDRNGKLRIEEVDTGAELLSQQLPGDVMATIAMSRDGSTVAVGSGPNTHKIFVWRWQAAEEPREIKGGWHRGRDLAFSADGKLLADCSDAEPDVRIWDVASGRLLHKLELPDHEPYRHYGVAFSPDAKLLAAHGGTNHRSSVHLWDPATGRFVQRLASGGALAFSPDGKLLVTGSRVWDLAARKELSANGEAHFGTVRQVVTGGKGLVVTVGEDHTVHLWDADTGKHLHRLAHEDWVGGVALSHDGRLLASGSADEVSLWDVATAERVYRLPGHGSLGTMLRPVAFTPGDGSFRSWGPDMCLRTWDVRTGKALAEEVIQPAGVAIPSEDDEPISRDLSMIRAYFGDAQFTPDAKRLVLQVNDKCFVFDAATGKERRSFPTETGFVTRLAVSPGGKEAVASARGKSVPTKLPDGTSQFSPPKGHLLTWWDLTTGERRRQVVLPEDGPGPVTFSPDGTQVAAAASQPGSCIRLMDAASGRELRKIDGLRSIVKSLAFMPDGKRLVSGLEDSSALIWDLTR